MWEEGYTDKSIHRYMDEGGHKTPLSFKVFCRIVTFTVANRCRRHMVSVTCVKLSKKIICQSTSYIVLNVTPLRLLQTSDKRTRSLVGGGNSLAWETG